LWIIDEAFMQADDFEGEGEGEDNSEGEGEDNSEGEDYND
jgi:hypothetical protein